MIKITITEKSLTCWSNQQCVRKAAVKQLIIPV